MENIRNLGHWIVKEKAKILFALFGLVISISCIWIYETKESSTINIIMVIVCTIYCSLQLYFLYFKDKSFNMTLRIIFSFLGTYMFALVFFAVILVFCAAMHIDSKPFDLLMYAFFILPSFVIDIMIIILGLMIAGGA